MPAASSMLSILVPIWVHAVKPVPSVETLPGVDAGMNTGFAFDDEFNNTQSSGVSLQEAYSLAKGKDKSLPVGKVGLVVRSQYLAPTEKQLAQAIQAAGIGSLFACLVVWEPARSICSCQSARHLLSC